MLKLLLVDGSIITHLYPGCLNFHFFSWLVTAFRDNGHLTAQQRRFNRALSSIRQKIERAISLLKTRWRKLLLLDHLDLELEVHIIVVACDETTIITIILNVRRKYTRKKIRVPDGI